MINRPFTSLLGSAVPMAQEQLGYTPTQMMAGSAVPAVQQQLGYTRQPPMMNLPVPQIQTPSGLGSLLAPAPQQKPSMLSGLLSGPGSSARYGALAKALTQNSATPMSFGQRLTSGLLAGSDAAAAQQEAAFQRGLLEDEMALKAKEVRLREQELTGGSNKISTETPVQYMVRQDDGTYKKEYVQSMTINGVEGLYKSVPKTEENPRGIKEVSLLDLGEIPEPSEGMTSVAVKLYDEANEAKRSVNNLSSFQTQVSKGFEGGLKGKIAGWTGDAKSFFGVDLTEKEGLKKLLVAEQSGILGQNRVAIVGPGVMTEQDADKVIKALGGDINSWFANPQILIDAIQNVKEENKDIFISKLNAYNALREGKFPELETFVDIFSAPPQYLAQGLTQQDWLAMSEEDRKAFLRDIK